MVDDKEWHKIGDQLTTYFNICGCQRKLKTIVDSLYSIYEKLIKFSEDREPLDFTGTEWLIVAMLDKNETAVCHGTNCEYPIILLNDPFWVWLIETKNNPNLEDN